MQKTCGMILFPGMTQLDLTGPYEILSRLPQLKVLLLAATSEPVRTEHGLRLTPDASFAQAPNLDILLIPGGPGVNETLLDPHHVDFVRHAAAGATWITSVCTGALLLGAAGLLRGYRATTHWRSLEFLPAFGAIPVADQRVVIDRNRITGGGVTAGIDFALALSAKIADEKTAQQIQLFVEYDPAPPFNSGHPRSAPPEILAAANQNFVEPTKIRRHLVDLAAARAPL